MQVTLTNVGMKKIQVIKAVRAYAASEADRELKQAKAIVDSAGVSPTSFEVSDDNTVEGVRRAFEEVGASVSVEESLRSYLSDAELRTLVEEARDIINDWDVPRETINSDPLLVEVFQYKLQQAHTRKVEAFHGLALA